MKVNISRKNLEEGILKVSKAVNYKSPLPILTHILFKTEGEDKIKLLSTDLELGIETIIKAQILKGGSFCIPARVITDIVTQLIDEDVVLELKEKILEIRTNNSKYNINILEEEDFPVFPKPKNIPNLVLEKKNFKKTIKDVIFASSQTEDMRTTLTGVLFNIKGQNLTLVTTDGRRLAKVEQLLKEVFPKEERLIIPAKSLQEVQRIATEEGEILVFINEGQVFFKFDETTIYSRIIDGKFPNYNQVIPSSYNIKIIINREKLLQSLRRALILACEKDSPKLIKIELSKNKMIITSATADMGNAYEEIELEEKEGNNIKIAFNGKYIADFLSNVSPENVVMQFTHSEGPTAMRLEKDNNYLYIIMPVKVREEEEKKEEAAAV